jgi:hypothetical protein
MFLSAALASTSGRAGQLLRSFTMVQAVVSFSYGLEAPLAPHGEIVSRRGEAVAGTSNPGEVIRGDVA